MLESKQTLIFRIFQILTDYSDENHPLKQQEIIDILHRDFGIDCERKAIGRNISYLRECGVEIHSDKKGSYLENRQFEPSELRLLIDSVLGSAHINATHSKDLIDKLVLAGGKYFKGRIKNIHSINDWNKSDNLSFFYNIDIIDEAIESGNRIRFYYNKYDLDKKLYHSARHIVSPYQMLLHNQHYYLFSRNEKWGNIGYYRIERITDIEILDEPMTPLRENDGYKNGINYKDISSHHPYMFTDKPQLVELKCDMGVIDAVIDWFGTDINIKDNGDGTLNVSMRTSIEAMEYWSMQYGKFVEVLSPIELRKNVRDSLEFALKKYKE